MKFQALVRWIAIGALLTALPCLGAAPAKKAEQPAAAKTKAPGRTGPKPTLANVAYGPHERQVLDFWKAESPQPTPLLFYIHGGGWMAGDKSSAGGSVAEFLAAGVSVAAINYRLVSQAHEAGVKPPVEWPLHDAARALQFVRSKAAEWGIDKTRVGATGGSAGACSSLWLAFHDDLADPKSADPVARESTRLTCAGVLGAQTSLDPKQMLEWIPNTRYGGHAFGFFGADKKPAFDSFLAGRESVMPWIKEYSPVEWVSADDPPVLLYYSAPPTGPGELPKDPTHSALFGVKLQEKLRAVGVESYLVYPGAPETKYHTTAEFLIDKLKHR